MGVVRKSTMGIQRVSIVSATISKLVLGETDVYPHTLWKITQDFTQQSKAYSPAVCLVSPYLFLWSSPFFFLLVFLLSAVSVFCSSLLRSSYPNL